MKMLFRLLLVLAVLVAGAWLLLRYAWIPEPFAPGSASAARLQAGPLTVSSYDTVLQDSSRNTAANGDSPGADSRTLKTTVWHPVNEDSGPYPLLVYSHGFSSSRAGGAYLARHMASLGYVVAAMDFPLTNMRAPGGPQVKDVVNQPGDVKFVIDSMLAASQKEGVLQGLVDPARIGVFGLSLGGLTTELVSFHPELRDPRIGASLSIAGPTFFLSPTFFEAVPQLPFMMLAGDIDALVPWVSNAGPIPDKRPGAELVTIRGASHTGFADVAVHMRWMDNPDALGCYIVTRNAGDAMSESWLDQMGSESQGIVADARDGLCEVDPLPQAMNVIRQQMISRVVVSSFFERAFSSSATERKSAEQYLSEQMGRELPDVDYQRK